jgi:hypothetical protein
VLEPALEKVFFTFSHVVAEGFSTFFDESSHSGYSVVSGERSPPCRGDATDSLVGTNCGDVELSLVV